MMSKVLAALWLACVAVGEENVKSGAACQSGSSAESCHASAGKDAGDKGMALLQRARSGSEGLSKVVLDTALEDLEQPLIRIQERVDVTVNATPGPLRLCHPAIVKRTCQKMNEGAVDADSVSMEQIQEVLSLNSSTVELLWNTLNLTSFGQSVPCEALCDGLVDYIRGVAILPPSSDRACATAGGQTKCDIDVSPQKLVSDMATTEYLQPDEGAMADSGENKGPALPQGLVQHVVEMASGGPRLVRRSSVADGSAASGEPLQLLQASLSAKDEDEEGSEVDSEGDTMPSFCPLTLWETVEILANFFRIFPSQGVSPVISGPEGPSLAQGGGEAATASGASVSQMIATANAQAKAWVSTVSSELAQQKTASMRQKWFGGGGSKSQSQIRSRLIKVMSFIQKELDTMHYVYPANQASDTACKGGVVAYVWKANSNYQGYEETKSPKCTSGSPMNKHCAVDGNGRYYVYLCEAFQTQPTIWRTGTLVHEAAHHTGPGDQSYDIPTMRALSQSKQLDNAANYQHFAQEVANAAYGCKDNSPPNVPFSCNPGPCTCSALSAYCQDATYGQTVRSQCGSSCGSCQMQGPAPAPPPPPPPPPAGGCSETVGKFTVTLGGVSYTAKCSGFASGGGCAYNKIKSKCPASCGACAAKPGCTDNPSYSIKTQIGTLTCNDWKQYECWDEVKPHCPVSCKVPGCTR